MSESSELRALLFILLLPRSQIGRQCVGSAPLGARMVKEEVVLMDYYFYGDRTLY